jgi:hypothetical protein
MLLISWRIALPVLRYGQALLFEYGSMLPNTKLGTASSEDRDSVRSLPIIKLGNASNYYQPSARLDIVGQFFYLPKHLLLFQRRSITLSTGVALLI